MQEAANLLAPRSSEIPEEVPTSDETSASQEGCICSMPSKTPDNVKPEASSLQFVSHALIQSTEGTVQLSGLLVVRSYTDSDGVFGGSVAAVSAVSGGELEVVFGGSTRPTFAGLLPNDWGQRHWQPGTMMNDRGLSTCMGSVSVVSRG